MRRTIVVIRGQSEPARSRVTGVAKTLSTRKLIHLSNRGAASYTDLKGLNTLRLIHTSIRNGHSECLFTKRTAHCEYSYSP